MHARTLSNRHSLRSARRIIFQFAPPALRVFFLRPPIGGRTEVYSLHRIARRAQFYPEPPARSARRARTNFGREMSQIILYRPSSSSSLSAVVFCYRRTKSQDAPVLFHDGHSPPDTVQRQYRMRRYTQSINCFSERLMIFISSAAF